MPNDDNERIHLWLSRRDLDLIDTWAKAHRMTRSRAIRKIIGIFRTFLESKIDKVAKPVEGVDFSSIGDDLDGQKPT